MKLPEPLEPQDLVEWRRSLSASQAQLAKVLQRSPRCVSGWERREYPLPGWLRVALLGAEKDVRRLVSQERRRKRANLRRIAKRERQRREREGRANARLEARVKDRARADKIRTLFAQAAAAEKRQEQAVRHDVDRPEQMRRMKLAMARGETRSGP